MKNIKRILVLINALAIIHSISAMTGFRVSSKAPASGSPAAQAAAISPAQQKTLDSLLQNMGNAQIKVFAHDDLYKKPIDTATWNQLINKIKEFVFNNAPQSDQQQLLTIGLNPILEQNTYLVDAVSGAQKAFATNSMSPAISQGFQKELRNAASNAAIAEKNLKNAGFQNAGSQLAQTAIQNLAVYIQDIANEANKQLVAKAPAAPATPPTSRKSTRAPAASPALSRKSPSRPAPTAAKKAPARATIKK